MEKLKGTNIQAEDQGTDITTLGQSNLPQICVTKTYHLSGVDISQGKASSGDDDEDSTLVDELIDDAKESIRKQVVDYYEKFGKGSEGKSQHDITNSEEFVGLDCTVSVFHAETVENLKDLEIAIEIHAYYDVPVRKLEAAIEAAKDALIGK